MRMVYLPSNWCHTERSVLTSANVCHQQEGNYMSKEHRSKKEGKKQSTMTPKERKAAKKAKKETSKSTYP